MTREHGVHELGTVFYSPATGFRPERLGRFALLRIDISDDLVKVVTEGGIVRLHASQVHVSYLPG